MRSSLQNTFLYLLKNVLTYLKTYLKKILFTELSQCCKLVLNCYNFTFFDQSLSKTIDVALRSGTKSCF